MSSYDDTEKGTFFEAWSLVKSSYETIKAGGDDAAELLQSAGVEGEVTVNENADKAFSALDSATTQSLYLRKNNLVFLHLYKTKYL